MSATNPRAFPLLWTARELPHSLRHKYGRCSVCGLMVAHRNRERHRKACGKRKREAPLRWQAWWYDMHRTPPERRTLPHEQ